MSEELLKLLYNELRRLARNKLNRQPNQSLEPTALVHEAYLRLAKNQGQPWQSRTDFYRAAARVMRFVLIDHIRQKQALKHGGGKHKVDIQVTLPGRKDPVSAEEMLALHDALERMHAEYPQHTEVVMLLYFSGLTVKEVAETLDTSVSTVERRWRFARAWLRNDMSKH